MNRLYENGLSEWMPDDWARIVDSLGERLNQSAVRRNRSAPSERGLAKAIGVLEKF
jgi:hypothetical protein